eukprot:scaffold5031_cov154-Skeletonema_marinoi.AAC.3
MTNNQQPATSGPDRIMNSQLLRLVGPNFVEWEPTLALGKAAGRECLCRRGLCSFNIGVTRY